MNRGDFIEIARDVLGQYTSQAKLDELFDRLRDAGRGPTTLEWRRVSPSSETSFLAISGDLSIATVRKNVFATNQEPYWSWTMSVDARTTGFKVHGNVEDLDTAKAAVLKNWQRWLDLAALRPRGETAST